MTVWKPIESAPKDGTVIQIGWKFEDDGDIQEWFTMRWGHIQKNGLFPGKVGVWVSPDGGLTWNDDGDAGPTHWRSIRF